MTSLFSTFLRDFKALHPGVKLVGFVLFLRTLGWGFVDPFFPMYLSQFRNDYVLIGLMVALIPLGALLTLVPLMRLADHVKDTALMRDGEVVYFWVIVLYLLAGFFKSVELLAFALFLNGIGQSLIIVGAETYIRRHDPLGHATPFGFYIALDYLGWVIGMGLGFFVIDSIGLNSMFIWVFPSIFGGILILPHIRDHGLKSLFTGFKKYFHSGHDLKKLSEEITRFNPQMFFLLTLSFFDGLIRMFSFTFIPLFGLSIGLSLKVVGPLMAATYAPFLLSFFVSEVEDRLDFMRVITVGLFVAAASYVFLYFVVHQAWVVTLIVITSFSLAIIRPAYNGVISRLAPRHMLGEVTGIHLFAERLGRIAGPVLAGWLADQYTLSMAFFIIALMASFLCVASLLFHGYRTLVSNPA